MALYKYYYYLLHFTAQDETAYTGRGTVCPCLDLDSSLDDARGQDVAGTLAMEAK